MRMDVRLVCGLALTALILGLSVFASAESLTVETKQGKVRGKTSITEK